jgi:hypothetical protein
MILSGCSKKLPDFILLKIDFKYFIAIVINERIITCAIKTRYPKQNNYSTYNILCLVELLNYNVKAISVHNF